MKDEITSPSEETTTNPETGVEKMPQTTNIIRFIESIRATDEYKGELEIRRSKLEISREKLDPSDLEPLTPEVLARSWEGRDEFKDFFFDYAERVVGLKYSDKIDPTISAAFVTYRDVVAQMGAERELNSDQSELIALDTKRGGAHNAVGRAIYEYLYHNGLYSNLEEDRLRGEVMGRCIAWSWLVNQGLDAWSSGRFIDERRRARAVIDGASLKIKTAYKPGDQRWFQEPDSINKAREIANRIFNEGELTEEIPTKSLSTPLHYVPPLTPQDDQERERNPLRGGRYFS